MTHTEPLSLVFRGSLLFGMLAVGLWLEYKRPLRTVTQPKAARIAVNLGVAESFQSLADCKQNKGVWNEHAGFLAQTSVQSASSKLA